MGPNLGYYLDYYHKSMFIDLSILNVLICLILLYINNLIRIKYTIMCQSKIDSFHFIYYTSYFLLHNLQPHFNTLIHMLHIHPIEIIVSISTHPKHISTYCQNANLSGYFNLSIYFDKYLNIHSILNQTFLLDQHQINNTKEQFIEYTSRHLIFLYYG